MSDLPDPLAELLQPGAPRDASDLQQRLRDQTSQIVRRRRLVLQLALAGSLAACVLLTVAVTYFIVRSLQLAPTETPPVVAAPGPVAPPVDVVEQPMSPVELEWRAFDSDANRAAAYFLAGDKYLEAGQDMESALRCYAQALDACTPAELDVTPTDNWLVVSLKNARRKEIDHD